MPRLTAATALIALAAAACTAGSGAASPAATLAPATPAPATSAPATSAPAPPVVDTEAPTSIPRTSSAVPGAYVEAAVADAASRAGVDGGSVIVISTGARDWPSGALGCPVVGSMYTDVITPGYRIVVEAGGTTYDYRAASRGSGAVRLCENPLGPDSQGPG